MAISKEILNNKKKKANQPEPLGTIPANNPDHVSAPIDFHHPIPPKPILHNSFNEAVNACEQIFLKPGEAHTEFYQTDGIIHCVVGIGNIKPDTKHLYLSDSGNIASISDQLNAMNEQVILMGKKVDNVYKTLTEKFDTLQEAVTEDIAELNQQFNDLSTNINNQLAQIQIIINQTVEQVTNISEKVDDISIYVNSFDERIKQNADNISDLSTRVEELENWKPTIDNSINQLELKSNQLDSSIIELHNLINEFEPIDIPSIRSLFHNDIYTVNLCCYTEAGHVEIFDDCGGINMGGDNTRVAECTPFNEYKTYVNGDDVSFMAVANEGYKFVKWWVNNQPNTTNTIIETTFEDSDIPVIGTLNNGSEPPILKFGYTAEFRKLHTLTLRVECGLNNQNVQQMFYNDTFKVFINNVEYDISKPIYFDDGDNIRIEAYPDIEGHHEFVNYVITENNIVTIYSDSTIFTKQNALYDLQVVLNIKENWCKITADANPANYGEIDIDLSSVHYQKSLDRRTTYYLCEDNMQIVANNNPGFKFINWTTSNNMPSIEQLESDINPYQLSDSLIILHINKNVAEYELVANFEED